MSPEASIPWWQGIQKADRSRVIFQDAAPKEENLTHLKYCYGPFDTEKEATAYRERLDLGFKEIEGTYLGDNGGR